MTYPDTLYAQGAELAEQTAVILLSRVPVLAEILSMPAPQGTLGRAWGVYRLEEAAVAASLWLPTLADVKVGLVAWREAVAFRWALVRLIEYRRDYADIQGEAILAAYHAACLYDWTRGIRFATYAKHWMARADKQYEAAMAGPVRVPRGAFAEGERAVWYGLDEPGYGNAKVRPPKQRRTESILRKSRNAWL